MLTKTSAAHLTTHIKLQKVCAHALLVNACINVIYVCVRFFVCLYKENMSRITTTILTTTIPYVSHNTDLFDFQHCPRELLCATLRTFSKYFYCISLQNFVLISLFKCQQHSWHFMSAFQVTFSASLSVIRVYCCC